jgi:serine/threonine-protein kinase
MHGGNLIGQMIGDYRVEALLGEGGMGVVYKAVHQTLGQIVAIKMLHPDLVADDKIRSRFVREAQAMARLNHPNIVRLINFLARDETYFIIMEFIEGKTVDRIMTERGLIPPLEAAEQFVQVLAALHYAHSLGIIHRDIKPSNICVLNISGMVKVLDFGTAKLVGAQRLTQEGMTLGTLIYMSPEQIVGRELDHRSDIYSLGVTLYEMVTAKLPHYDNDEMALVKAIARGVPDPPSVHYKHIPKRLEKCIMKAIEKDPARRYQTADEFMVDLKGFISEEKQKLKKSTPPQVKIPAVDVAPIAQQPPGAPAGAGARPGALAPGAAPAGAAPVTPARAGAGGGGVGLLVLAVLFGLGGFGAGLAILSGAIPVAHAPVAASGVIGVGMVLALIFGVLGIKKATAPAVAVAAPGAAAGGLVGGPAAPPQGPFGGTLDGVAPPAGGAPRPPLVEESTLSAAPPRGPAPAPPPQLPVPPMPAQPPGMPAAAAYLYVLEGNDKGKSWPIPHGAMTIGRGPNNMIMLNDPGVSTSHAQVGFDGQGFVVADLQSRNGSYVNNQRVHQARLNDRDVLVFGTTQILFALAPTGR